MALQLINNKTGQPVDVRDNEVHQAVSSGAYSFAPGTKIPVQHPETGEVQSIPSENVGEAFKSGYTLPSLQAISSQGEQAVQQRQQEFLNAPSSQVAAFGTGLAGGATFGLTDVGLRMASPESADLVHQVQQANPVSTMAGQAVGMLAPTGAGGLISAAGKAGERVAARAASSLVPSIAQGIVGKAINKGLGGMIEGSLMTGGQAISEASLGDPNEVASNLAGNLAIGAMFGGALGAGMEVASPAAKKLADLVGKGASSVVGDVEGAIKNRVFGAMGEDISELAKSPMGKRARELASQEASINQQVGRDLTKVEQEGKEATQQAKEIYDSVLGNNKEAVRKATEGNLQEIVDMSGHLKQIGNEEINPAFADGVMAVADKEQQGIYQQTLKSVEDAKAQLTALPDSVTKRKALEALEKIKNDTNPQAYEALADQGQWKLGNDVMNSQAIKQGTGDLAFQKLPRNSPEAFIVGKLNAQIKDAIRNVPEIGALAKKTDDFWTNTYELNRIIQRNFKEMAGSKREFNLEKALDKYLGKHAGLDEATTRTLSELAESVPEAQGALDNFMVNKANREAVKVAQLKQADILSGVKSGELPVKALIDDIVANGGGARVAERAKKIGDAAILADIRAASPNASNVDIRLQLQRKLGMDVDKSLQEIHDHMPDIARVKRLQEKMREHDSGNTLGVAGAAVGGMLGGKWGAAAGGTIGKLAGGGLNPLRMMDTFRTIEGAGAYAGKQIAAATKGTIDALTSPTARKAATSAYVSHSIDERRELYKKMQQSVSASQDNINRLHQNIDAQIAPHAPQIADALKNSVNVTQQFLMSKMPQDPTTQSTFLPSKSKYIPSDAELAKFDRYVSAVGNPAKVIENIGKGTVSPEEIEALKATNPIQFKQLQSSILSAIMEKQSDLSYKQRLTLGSLFDIPSDPSLTSAMFTEMQQNFVQKNNGEQGGRPPVVKVNAKKMSDAAMPMSENERVKYK